MLCSAAPNGEQGDANSGDPDISADGRYVVFRSASGNLVSGTAAGRNHIFRKDLATGVVTLCSASSAEEQANADCSSPSVSSDGRFVCFHSAASNLITGHPTTGFQVFRKDMLSGEVLLCSESASGADGDGISDYSDISSDGRFVTFQSKAGNLLDGTTTSQQQVFRKDLQTGTVDLCSSSASGSLVIMTAPSPG